MSSANYNLKNKGVRLISSDDAWIKGKNGKQRLNPKYNFVGKIDTKLPNMIITASDKKKEKAEVKTSAQRIYPPRCGLDLSQLSNCYNWFALLLYHKKIKSQYSFQKSPRKGAFVWREGGFVKVEFVFHVCSPL